MQWLINIKQSLVAFDPRLWPLVIALVVGALYWLFRKFFPTTFDKLPSKLKALPGAVIAALLSGAAAPDIKEFVIETIIGALTAGGGHEFITRLMHGSKLQRVAKKERAALAKKNQEKLE